MSKVITNSVSFSSSPPPEDYYEVLGIPPKTSNVNMIDVAFYELLCDWYPSINPRQRNLSKNCFNAICEAYQVVGMDYPAGSKKIYDQHGKKQMKSSSPRGYGSFCSYQFKLLHPEDVFAEFVVFKTIPYLKITKYFDWTFNDLALCSSTTYQKSLDYFCNILGVKMNLSNMDELHIGYAKKALKWHPRRLSDQPRKTTESIFQLMCKAYEVLSKVMIDKVRLEDVLRDMSSYTDERAYEVFADFFFFKGLFQRISTLSWNEDESSIPIYTDPTTEVTQPEIKACYIDLHCTLEDLYVGKNITHKYLLERSADNERSTWWENFKFSIPRGALDGSRITFRGRWSVHGNLLPRKAVVFIIKENSHERFTRMKNDLLVTVNVTCMEAATGNFDVKIETLDGRILDVSINLDDVHDESSYTVLGEGMPIVQKSYIDPPRKGNLIIDFKVIFPKNWRKFLRKVMESQTHVDTQV